MSISIDVIEHIDTDTETAVWTLYHEVFADQPDRATWQTMWNTHTHRRGFRLARATTDNGALVGFCYGYTGSVGQWWTDRAIEQLPPQVARTWLSGHLEVVSLAVGAAYRNQGLGRGLLGELLHAAPHDRAVLMTNANPTDPAHRLYLATGWQIIGAGIRPCTVIMGKSPC